MSWYWPRSCRCASGPDIGCRCSGSRILMLRFAQIAGRFTTMRSMPSDTRAEIAQVAVCRQQVLPRSPEYCARRRWRVVAVSSRCRGFFVLRASTTVVIVGRWCMTSANCNEYGCLFGLSFYAFRNSSVSRQRACLISWVQYAPIQRRVARNSRMLVFHRLQCQACRSSVRRLRPGCTDNLLSPKQIHRAHMFSPARAIYYQYRVESRIPLFA